MTKQALPTVCIIYGFCEGPRIGRPLLTALRQAGYQIVSAPEQADIVIGHSGGCFLLPSKARAQCLFMIGLPYWPGKSTLQTLIAKNRAEIHSYYVSEQFSGWLHKICWNLVYFWKMSRNISMLRAQKRQDYWQAPSVVLIRNREDLCCTPAITAQNFRHGAALVALPGHHDDLWLHPQSYVAIINYYAKQLLAEADR